MSSGEGGGGGGADVVRTPSVAHDNALALLSSGERDVTLTRVVREGPGPNEPDWLIVESALKVRVVLGEAQATIEEVRSLIDTVRGLQVEINETARSLANEREERIGKLIEPITQLAAAIVKTNAAEQRAAGAQEVKNEASVAIRALAEAAGKAVDRVAPRSEGVFWKAWSVASGLLLVVMLVLLVLHRV